MWQMPCRIRLISLGSVIFLLIANIWLIFRRSSNAHCPTNERYDSELIQNYQQALRKTIKDKQFTEETYSRYNVKKFEEDDEEYKGFDISFDLGRWDKARLFKMFDFISVGEKFVSLSDKYSVCIATQSSIEKLYSIVEVSEKWAGPISVALYAAGDEEYFLLHWYVTYLQECFSSVKLKVSFHLAVSKFKIPTGKFPEKLKDLKNIVRDCVEPKKVLEDVVKLRSSEIVKWRTKSPYPQNHLRNLARKNCQCENVFLTDVDIIPCYNLTEKLVEFLKSPSRKCPGKCAYVIPTFELDDRMDFPTSKKELVRLAKKGLARAFHHKVFIYNQFATNFSRWEKFSDRRDNKVVISHNVTNFEFLYEPFYVAPDNAPEHDERFLGYGYTRNTQVYEMYVAGYKFQVLSPIFTIHWGLQGRKGRPPWRERQNSLNRRQFDVFKREIFARYRKDPLKMVS